MIRIAENGFNRGVTALGPTADRWLPGLRHRLTKGLTVFIFHEVTDTPSPFHREHHTYTSPSVFQQQVEWIKERFAVISPASLHQFGGSGALPSNAAMLTFDDSWAGTARVALPILMEKNLPALWFLNMATVHGDPDFAAVRGYEAKRSDGLGGAAPGSIDLEHGTELVVRLRERYCDDPSFRAYSGPTATPADVQAVADQAGACFGSHLFHHWNLRLIGDDLYEDSLTRNARALKDYPNTLPAFAPPHGYAGEDGRDLWAVAKRTGVKVIFTGRGLQNARADGRVIERVLLPPEPSTPRGWWHGTHLARLIGPRAR